MKRNKNPQIENEKDSADFSLDEQLKSVGSDGLYDIIQNLIVENPDNYRLVLEWFKRKRLCLKDDDTSKEETFVNDELLMEYWENARSIISEFNEYGGGPRDDEEEAYDWLDDILDLIKEGHISTDVKFALLDEGFKEYNIGNSGFEDELMDIFFQLCSSKEEWAYLVEKLEEKPSRWRRKHVMRIQKEYLCDEDAYLKMRLNDLQYGVDYWDLAKFYYKKGNLQKAVETAEEGLIKGKGRISQLLEFLFNYYENNEDTANLERIVQCSFHRKGDEREMLEGLFEYYRKQNDYENAKKALLKGFKYTKGEGYVPKVRYYAYYNKMKQFLNEMDWKNIEPEILPEIQKKDLISFLRICMDKGRKEEVVRVVLNPPKKQSGFLYEIEYNFDEFADQLKTDYPEEMINYYWQKAYDYIKNGNRMTYQIAVEYLQNVKHIYIDILNKESIWEQRFNDLKIKCKKRRAFLDEAKKL